jgi:hypothetical protein
MSMSSSLSSALIGVEMPVATMSKSVFYIPKTRYFLFASFDVFLFTIFLFLFNRRKGPYPPCVLTGAKVPALRYGYNTLKW